MHLIEMISEELLQPEDRDTRYDKSVFKHIKSMGAKQKGKYYELITEDVMKKLGYNVENPKSTEYDRIIDGVKTEIKGSTLNKGTDVFSFLQIRPDQDYEELVFSMFYPDKLVIMKMDKELTLKHINDNKFKKQHGGNKGNSGTYCYYGNEETLLKLGAKKIGKKTY